MALFNEIQAGRFNRALQKLTGIKGGAAVKQLGSELMPTVSLFWGAEMRYLESWQIFGIAWDVAAAAANISAFQIRNPPTSNVICVVFKLLLMNDSASQIRLNLEFGKTVTTDLATDLTTSVSRFDARGQQNTSVKVSSTNVSGSFGAFDNTPLFATLPANISQDTILTDNQEFPILPGDYMRIRNPALNASNSGVLWWRERFLEDSERF